MNRRNFIVTAGVLSSTGLAGCMGSNEIDEYPDGLSEEGITDIDTILGRNSPYLNTDSVTISINGSTPGGKNETTERIDATVPKFYINSIEKLPDDIEASVGDKITEQYFIDNMTYIRNFVENSDTNESFQKREFTFNKRQEYYSQYLTNILSGIEFSESTINEEGILYKGVNFTSESSLTGPQVVDNSIEVLFQKDGKIRSVSYTVVREYNPEDEENRYTEESSQTLQFSDYNNTSVSEPDWLTKAQNRT